MTDRNDDGQFSAKYVLSGEYSDLYENYGGWVTVNSDRSKTITRLKAGVRAWLYWCEQNDLHPFEATENSVRSYIKTLQIDGQAETSITRAVASVSKYYHFLITDPDTDACIDTNPTEDIKLRRDYDISNRSEYVKVMHRDERDDVIALEYEDIEPIFSHVPGKRVATRIRNQLICALFWQTAVRSDELSRFRLDNVVRENREIKFRSSKLNKKDHPDLYRRHVWWEQNLDGLMQRWRDKREDFDPEDSSPYLFVSENGKQLSPSYLSRIVKQAAHNAGLNEPLVRGPDGDVKQWLYTAHRLRHSRITYLANDPVRMDLDALRMMAGHVSFDTTLTYVDPDWDTAKNAYERALN